MGNISKDSIIVITGITGLVGSQLAAHLISKGYNNIKGLVRREAEVPNGIELIRGDILDILSLDSAFERANLIIHCAAMVSFDPRDKENLYKVNAEGTANVIDAALHNKVENVIYISSVAALGKPEQIVEFGQEVSISENQKWLESPENSNYAKSKFQAECEIRRGEAEGLNVQIANPSIILGEGDWTTSSSRLFKYVWDEKSFLTNGFLNYIDIKDLVHIIGLMISKPQWGERFILSAGKIEFSAFFEQVAERFNKLPPKIKLNSFWIGLLWRIERIRSIVFKTTPLITQETAKTANSNYYFHSEKVKSAYNFEYTPLDDSLERICLYYCNKKSE